MREFEILIVVILLSIYAIIMTVVFDYKKSGETSALCDIVKAVDSSAFSKCHGS